jgi:nitroreductase
MNFLNLVRKRKSIRDFLNTPIEKKKINLCLEAARQAPSACNAQPWHFIVVDNSSIKRRLCEEAFGGIYAINKFVKSAPVVIVVISEKRRFLSRLGSYLRDTRFYLIDIGIACEHLILQATELGLGSCWIGWFNEKKVKKILNIPHHKRVEVLIALGYPKTEKEAPPRRSLEEIISFNRYP